MTKSIFRILGVVLGVFVASAASAPTLTLKFKTIKIPGAIYTEIDGINNAGIMVGIYANNETSTHGFMLTGKKVITIDDPEAAQYTGCSAWTGCPQRSGHLKATRLLYRDSPPRFK